MMKKMIRAFLRPRSVILWLLTPICAVLLFLAFYKYEGEGFIAYASYALSTYTLTAVCIRTPQIVGYLKHLRRDNLLIKRFFEDKGYRARVTLYLSLIMNTAFAVFQLCLGFYHGSVWFYSLSAYYFILAIMRYYLLRYASGNTLGENRVAELRGYRFCGICLMVMTLALALIIFFITYWGRTFTHHYITTIAMAAFTFEALISAIIGAVKSRNDKSPALMAINTVALSSALVSMLTLEVAMLNVFGGEESAEIAPLMIEIFGAFVTVFILAMAITVTIRTTKEIRKEQNEDE